MCLAATLRRDHGSLNRAAFLPLVNSQASAAANQSTADELQLYAPTEVVQQWIRVRDTTAWETSTKAVDYDGLGGAPASVVQSLRRLCAVQIMEKTCYENLRLAFEHRLVAATSEPRPAVAAEKDYEARTVATLLHTQVGGTHPLLLIWQVLLVPDDRIQY